MANIAIIKLLYGMTITGAQLAGELLTHGHQTKIIYFKRQETVRLEDVNNGEFQLGDIPMQNHVISRDGDYIIETSIWKKIKPHELKHLVKLLQEISPDAIGISTLSLGMTLASEVTQHLREHFTQPILWGGTGPTLEPDRSITDADLVCVGEGEDVIIEIANRLDNQQSLEGIAGTWFKFPDGLVQKNPKRPVSNLEKIAVPDWNARNFSLISGLRFDREFDPDTLSMDHSYYIMTQRGCPFSCSFCVESFYQNEFGKKDSLRRMSPEKTIRELRIAKNVLGYKTVTFMDDVFTINPRWLQPFLTMYKEEIGLPFFCYTYPTTHNPDILAMIKDAGCYAITMGVQSGSDRILTEIYNRPTKMGRVIEAANEIVASGIAAASFDMIPYTGFDAESDLQETLDVLLKIPKEMNTTFYTRMAYFPNYPIIEKLKDEALIAKSDNLDIDVYSYYFKLFELTRSIMPMEEIRTIAANPIYRANHYLLNPFLPDNKDMKPGLGSLIQSGIENHSASLPIAS